MSVIEEKNQLLKVDIIRNLYYHETLSLADLSKFTHKSLPVVTAAVNELIASRYIIEQGLAPSTGGRRPTIYLINSTLEKYIVAVAMDQLITRLTIYNLSRKVIYPMQQLDYELSSPDNTVDDLIYFINTSIEKSGLDRENIIGIGVSMPGFVNLENGVNHSYLKVKQGQTLQKYLSLQTNLPVFIDNDSSLIAHAELKFGEAKNMKEVMVINIGWGTGLGMIINGKLYRGSSGSAGEFSHIPLSDSDNLCSCGRKGCLEVDTSLIVMAKRAKEAIAKGADSKMKEMFLDKNTHEADHFLNAVSEQDPVALSVMSKAIFQLGKGIATLIHIMNPECIVLSGKGSKAGSMLLPPIQQAINEFCIPRIANQTKIKISKLTEDAGLLASASLVIENTLINQLPTLKF